MPEIERERTEERRKEAGERWHGVIGHTTMLNKEDAYYLIRIFQFAVALNTAFYMSI